MFRCLLVLLMMVVVAPANADDCLVGRFHGAVFHHGGFPSFHHRGGHSQL